MAERGPSLLRSLIPAPQERRPPFAFCIFQGLNRVEPVEPEKRQLAARRDGMRQGLHHCFGTDPGSRRSSPPSGEPGWCKIPGRNNRLRRRFRIRILSGSWLQVEGIAISGSDFRFQESAVLNRRSRTGPGRSGCPLWAHHGRQASPQRDRQHPRHFVETKTATGAGKGQQGAARGRSQSGRNRQRKTAFIQRGAPIYHESS